MNDHAALAGLPSPILHGTCTLALAVGAALAWAAGDPTGDQPDSLRRVRARFSGMVTMPAELELRAWRDDARQVRFEVASGATVVLRDGRLDFTP
jgi:acyl dehydratase